MSDEDSASSTAITSDLPACGLSRMASSSIRSEYESQRNITNEMELELLNQGGIPNYEPGLEDMVKRNVEAGRLRFTTDVAKSALHGTIQFFAVGTPPDQDGSADLQNVLAVARAMDRNMQEYKVIVDKSTEPVATADKVREAVKEELNKLSIKAELSVVSNPEFLGEGAAADDFNGSGRIAVGIDDDPRGKINAFDLCTLQVQYR